MAYKVVWSPSAKDDLKEIFEFISADDSEAAARVSQKVIECTKHLSRFPQLGRVVPEIGWPHLREIVSRPYRIIYREDVTNEQVQIVRVWHAARGHPVVD